MLHPTGEPQWACFSSWCCQWPSGTDAVKCSARWRGKEGLRIWGAEWSTCSWQHVSPGIWSCLAAPGGDKVPHHRPSELCFAASKEVHKRKAETQPSSRFSTVMNVFFWFRWREGLEQFLFMRLCWSPCGFLCVHPTAGMSGNTARIFFLISWRSNDVTFETLCEDEGFSKLKSWIRCGSSCHVISPNVFMSAEKTRARLSDLERKCPRERLLHAIFNTLLSDFFFFLKLL